MMVVLVSITRTIYIMDVLARFCWGRWGWWFYRKAQRIYIFRTFFFSYFEILYNSLNIKLMCVLEILDGGHLRYCNRINIYILVISSTNTLPKHKVIEWLLININSVMFQIYHDKNKLIFHDDEVRFALQ